MHEFLVRAAKVISRYTVVVLLVSMIGSAAVAQNSRSRLGDIPEGALEMLQQLQSGRGTGVGVGTLDSDLDVARERQAQSELLLDGVDPRLLGLDQFERVQSPIEKDYSDRSEEDLIQFGYDLFSGEISGAPLVGAVQESYILGVGDDIVVTFRGQQSDSFTVRVDREGRVVLPNLPPVPAAGRAFGSFRADLETLTEQTFLGTEVFASVGKIRALRVLVVGEVRYPGYKQVTSLSTALDALALAGGINKAGSLRQVILVRQGKPVVIDLYDLLLRGHVEHDLTLVEGDRIVVPSIGGTVAVGGWVKRPGIFELPPDSDEVALDRIARLAGGNLRPYGLRYLHLQPDETGKQIVVERTELAGGVARDGDILLVNLRENVQVGDVSIDGHVRVQERRSLNRAPTLHDLLRDGSTILPDPYLLFAAVETIDAHTRARRYYPISVSRVLAGAENFSLRDGDRLIIFSMKDIRFLRSPAVQAVLAGLHSAESIDEQNYRRRLRGEQEGSEFDQFEDARNDRESLERRAAELELRRKNLKHRQTDKPQLNDEEIAQLQALLRETEQGPCSSLDALADIVAASPSGRFSGALTLSISQEDVDRAGAQTFCPEIFDKNPDLLVFALDHVVSLDGEVREPGAYPIISGVNTAALLGVAGGPTRQADLTNVEITRIVIDRAAGTSNLERRIVNVSNGNGVSSFLDPGDVVRFNQVFSDLEEGVVVVAGEFLRPGKYRIRRGETLSELIARAGNLTPQAYPYGAIFTRESAKVAEKEALERSVRDLEGALATASTTQTSANRSNVDMSGVRQLIEAMRRVEPVGRIVVEADPTILQVRPDMDILMQPGDMLIMPKRPSSVSVTGEVLNPGSQQFRTGSRPEDYLRLAGGTRPGADGTRTFMVLPNGEAQPLDLAFWNYEPVLVPPGATIIVPRDPAPFDFLTLAKDMSQILGQLSLVAASIAVITDN